MDAFPFSKGFVIMAANVITSFLGAPSISALYVCTFSLVLHPFGMSPRDIPPPPHSQNHGGSGGGGGGGGYVLYTSATSIFTSADDAPPGTSCHERMGHTLGGLR